MDLLERYLQAIGQYLPPDTRQDTLAELRANLLAQMDVRSEELGRPLTNTEIASILEAHGRPVLVAGRYLPQRSLIGPVLFPVYLITLRKALPIVLLIYFITRALTLVFAPTPGTLAAGILTAFAQLIPVLLCFWSIVTIIFASLEFAQTEHGEAESWKAWEAGKLPPLTRSTGQRSLATRIADLVVHGLWLLYVVLIPRHPWLALGPGATILRGLSITFAPVWHVFYIAFLILLLAQLTLKLTAFFPAMDRLRAPVELFFKFFGIGPTAMLAFSRVYFVATSPATDLRKLAAVNMWMGLSIRIVLFFVVLDFALQAWKYLSKAVPTHRLAF